MNPFLLFRIGLAMLMLIPAAVNAVAQETNGFNPADASAILAHFGRRAARVHDPSTVVKCGDEYWLFATGNRIASWHSKDLTNWSTGPRVFSERPAWTTNVVPGNRGNFWAPDVIYQTNRYLLYYSVSTFGTNVSAIGLASNPTLDPADPNYTWTDLGMVIQSTARDDYNAIDPAVARDAGGGLWLSFGSFWSGIKLVQLDAASGKRIATNSPIHALAYHDPIEASYVYFHEGFYYLFVNWGDCCKGVNSTYNIRVGRSDKITGPYLDKEGLDLRLNGGSLVLGTSGPFIGPGHAGIITVDGASWFSCHFYDGTRNGSPTLAVMPLHWSANGWPEIEPFPPK